ncbi:uncharacterized protein LOC124292197 [Haliotis rubra]|uniref:uncharacterized protein LOC124292197 n=1 Tax=Haliotis rubra TaxID=36100 RepID=UPI001EE4EF49|nr:uncharacterized protein LOC124292197 [Haliotis rubra]
MATMTSLWAVLVMFVKVADSAMSTSTRVEHFFLDTFGLGIMGFWSVKFEVRGTKNVQFGLFGPTRSTSNGYAITLNNETGGDYFSAVRKICSSCPGTPNVEMNQGGSFLDPEYHPFWISWDQATIKMGKGVVVGEEIVVSWTDPNIIEVNYFTIGASDAATSVFVRYEKTCAALNRPALFPACNKFFFQLSNAGKKIWYSTDIISEAAGMTKTDCIYKCLVTTNCIGFTLSTTGTCKLTNKCAPTIGANANTNFYQLKSFSTP